MNWICDCCGYENEFNAESQPTRCLCCDEPATEAQLEKARREYREFCEEQERLRIQQQKIQEELRRQEEKRQEELRIQEQKRQEALKRQQKIARANRTIRKSMKAVSAACILFLICSAVLLGLNIYKGNFSAANAADNIKNIAVSHLETRDTIVRNAGYTIKNRDTDLLDHIQLILENQHDTLSEFKDSVQSIGKNIRQDFKNRVDNVPVPKNNISTGFSNFRKNMGVFWKQAVRNVKQFVDDISEKIRRLT